MIIGAKYGEMLSWNRRKGNSQRNKDYCQMARTGSIKEKPFNLTINSPYVIRAVWP